MNTPASSDRSITLTRDELAAAIANWYGANRERPETMGPYPSTPDEDEKAGRAAADWVITRIREARAKGSAA